MSASIPQSQFFFALVVLLAIHTAVSFGAYHWLTKRTVQESPMNVPVEVTTRQQAARGEHVYVANTRVVSRTVPWPVVCYIWSGYVGLAVAVLLWAFRQARPIQP